VVLYEHVWLLDVLVEWGTHGGRLVADGGIPHDALLAALDATEPTPVEPTDLERRCAAHPGRVRSIELG
jgi:hypothetical protein